MGIYEKVSHKYTITCQAKDGNHLRFQASGRGVASARMAKRYVKNQIDGATKIKAVRKLYK